MSSFFRTAAAVPRLEVADPDFNIGRIIGLYRKAAAEKEISMQQYRSLDSLLERVRRFQWKMKLENEYNTVTEKER